MSGPYLKREEYARLIEVWIGEQTLELLNKRDRLLARWDTYHKSHCHCKPELGFHAADLLSQNWLAMMQEELDDAVAYGIFSEERDKRYGRGI